MTTPLDRTIPPAVLALIARFGVAARLSTHENVVYRQTARDADGAETPTTVVVTPPLPVRESHRLPGADETSGYECWLAARGLTVVPRIGDHLSITGSARNMTFTAIETYYSGDSVAAYRLIGEL